MADYLAKISLRPAFRGEMFPSIIVSFRKNMSKRFNEIQPRRFVFSLFECGRALSKRKY